MRDLNCVQLIGRLGQDPEVHYTGTGTARTTFSIVTNRTWTDMDGPGANRDRVDALHRVG